MMLELKIRENGGEDAIVSKEHNVYYFVLHIAVFLEDRKLILE